MAPLTWTNDHRWWVIVPTIVVLLAAGAVSFWFVVLRSVGNPVDLRDALRLYRNQGGTGDVAEAGLPQPGVYQYRTSGDEQLSLAGIHRAFPPLTNMIVTEGTCATVQWQGLQQHVEQIVECSQPDGALSLSSATTTEQIAAVSSTTVVDCPKDTFIVPAHPRVGQRWSSSCHQGRSVVTVKGRVIGSAPVTVGTQSVAAIHTRFTMYFSGSEHGVCPTDVWIAPTDGLILRQRETASITQASGPLGSIRYSETMNVALQSLVPMR
ncbi:MAG TPA: hypothetical protein VG226_01980 [Acidimicrobiales bacterium]|nr:hypothetical protein [Acidimicrobiales bacterium]